MDLQYADDYTLVTHTSTDLQNALTAASAIYETFRLKANTGKTEVLCWRTGGNTAPKIVRGFKYFGTYLTPDCRIDRKVEHRISCAAGVYHRLRRVFTNHYLSLTTKIKVYYAISLSALLYESEAWTLYARKLKLLKACISRASDPC